MTEYSPTKTGKYPSIFANFQNRAHCENYLKRNKHNSLHLTRKYARYLSADITLSENCSLLGTDNGPRTNIRAYFRSKWRILFTYIIYGVILGVHLFTFLFPVCLSLFYVSLINVNSLLFTQSPCEYNPCKNGAPCLPLYRSNSYLCMLRPGKIEQGRINIELQIYKKLILVLCAQT